jgi:hypothetical protein
VESPGGAFNILSSYVFLSAHAAPSSLLTIGAVLLASKTTLVLSNVPGPVGQGNAAINGMEVVAMVRLRRHTLSTPSPRCDTKARPLQRQ